MASLHAEDYVVDWVYGDAFEDPPVSAEESAALWSGGGARRIVSPQGVSTISAALILLTALVVFVALRLPTRAEAARDLAWEASQGRVMAARSFCTA